MSDDSDDNKPEKEPYLPDQGNEQENDYKLDYRFVFGKPAPTYTATQIGRFLRPAQSAKAVNELLKKLGFQMRVGDTWVGNPSHGRHWATVTVPVPNAKGSKDVLRWHFSVVAILQAALN